MLFWNRSSCSSSGLLNEQQSALALDSSLLEVSFEVCLLPLSSVDLSQPGFLIICHCSLCLLRLGVAIADDDDLNHHPA